MADTTPRARLLRVLRKAGVDRPPVICTGGMMNAAILEVTGHSTATLPAAHTDAALMADLAGEIARVTGFENLGVPFCMTVEAEALGSEISLGTQACEPKIERERYASVEAVEPLPLEQLLASPRVAVVAEAVQQLAARHPELPVIGSLTGPLSTAASLVDPPASQGPTEAPRGLPSGAGLCDGLPGRLCRTVGAKRRDCHRHRRPERHRRDPR